MRAKLPAPALQVSDWIDVMDEDGIWNVAQVLRLPTPETVEVKYDCWGNEYNEKMRCDSERIAPFHTHTWAVKCWAKMETWPWWPALVTVRAPGSAQGSLNLRLEKRLLVDFLDTEEFTERCRCWVEKSKIVPLRQERKKVSGSIKNRKNIDKKFNSLELSTKLLASCDAREDFPKFAEGTLPVQFNTNFTRQTAKLRKEIGEDVWMRKFADNRILHAATHAYTPVLTDKNDLLSKTGFKAVNSLNASRTKDSCILRGHKKIAIATHTVKDDGNVAPIDLKNASKKTLLNTVKMKHFEKRSRSFENDKIFNSTDTSQSEMPHAPSAKSQDHNTTEFQFNKITEDSTFEDKFLLDNQLIHVSTRKNKNTAGNIKSFQRSANRAPSYTPPYAGMLPREKTEFKQNLYQLSINKNARTGSHAKKTHAIASQINTQTFAEKSVPAVFQQASAAVKRKNNGDSKMVNRVVSPLECLARLTKSTLRDEMKLRAIEAALKDRLSELSKKSARVEKMRKKCVALHLQKKWPAFQDQPCIKNKLRESSSVRTLKSLSGDEKQRKSKHSVLRENLSTTVKNIAPQLRAIATTNSEVPCGVRRLELLLDDIFCNKFDERIRIAATSFELDGIKAKILNFPEVQAAIADLNDTKVCDSSGKVCCHTWKKRKACARGHASNIKLLECAWSPSPTFVGLCGIEHKKKSDGAQYPSSSALLESSAADYSDFSFSVNDTFSMNQWYQGLYPKAFKL